MPRTKTPTMPSSHATSPTTGVRNGRTLVIVLVVLMLLAAARFGWLMQQSGGSFGPPRAVEVALPPEPLLEGLADLDADAFEARKRALAAAIDCIERHQCDGVSDTGRILKRKSLPFRTALSTLMRTKAVQPGGGQ
jgi:hypothetical protein